MGHDDGTDKASGHTPRGGVAVLELIILIQEFDIKGFGEVLPEVMRGAALERAGIAHHGFNSVGMLGAGKFLGLAFAPRNDRDGSFVDGKIGVDIEHAQGFLFGFLSGGVGGMTLLPIKLERAEEETGAHLPADNIAPLVDEHGQVAVGLDPLGIHGANNGFRGWANDKRFLELLTAAVGDDRELWREAFDMLLLFFKERHGYKERESSVDMPGGFETLVEGGLDILPKSPAVRANDHTTAHRGVICQLGTLYQLVIPFGEIFIF